MRTMRTLWIAMIASIAMYYLLTLFMSPPERVEPDNTMFLALLVAAVLTVPVSFLIKNRLLAHAAHQQRVQLVQQGYILAWAISEVAALLGLLVFYQGHKYYYVLFLIGACAQLLHFPRREHVINASFKTS
jgi:hypothetical protein